MTSSSINELFEILDNPNVPDQIKIDSFTNKLLVEKSCFKKIELIKATFTRYGPKYYDENKILIPLRKLSIIKLQNGAYTIDINNEIWKMKEYIANFDICIRLFYNTENSLLENLNQPINNQRVIYNSSSPDYSLNETVTPQQITTPFAEPIIYLMTLFGLVVTDNNRINITETGRSVIKEILKRKHSSDGTKENNFELIIYLMFLGGFILFFIAFLLFSNNIFLVVSIIFLLCVLSLIPQVKKTVDYAISKYVGMNKK